MEMNSISIEELAEVTAKTRAGFRTKEQNDAVVKAGVMATQAQTHLAKEAMLPQKFLAEIAEFRKQNPECGLLKTKEKRMPELTIQELMDSIQKFPVTLRKLEESIREKRISIDSHRKAIEIESNAISDIESAMDVIDDAYTSALHQLATRFKEAVRASKQHNVSGASEYVTVGELDEAQKSKSYPTC